MPKNVYNNVVDHRIIDNKRVVEDVTSVTLPTVEFDSTTIDVAGLTGTVDMPNTYKVKAMTAEIAHNNGTNTDRLTDPGLHTLEFRLARQRYITNKATMNHESVKYRITGYHTSTNDGRVQTGNPLGGTEKFNVLRFEKIVNGKTAVKVDVMAGSLEFNGKSEVSGIQKLLE